MPIISVNARLFVVVTTTGTLRPSNNFLNASKCCQFSS